MPHATPASVNIRADLEIARPYLLFVGDAPGRLDAKTALGLLDWRREWCAGQLRFPGCPVDLGLPELSPVEAVRRGVRTLVVGVAPVGGRIPDAWERAFLGALEAGLNVAAGLHDPLQDRPRLVAAAARRGLKLHDVRQPPAGLVLPVASGARRAGRRLLTVGTDCAIGKKYTALALEREMRARGWQADFRATGQTGVLISGGGLAIDAVVADFVAGAAELIAPANAPEHWDLIEGQGSLYHPGYASVSLGLLHGAQPHALVLCHDPRRTHIDGYPDFPLPALAACIGRNLELARLTSPDVRCVGVSLNTGGMTSAARAAARRAVESECGVPCVDPLADGTGPIVDFIATHLDGAPAVDPAATAR